MKSPFELWARISADLPTRRLKVAAFFVPILAYLVYATLVNMLLTAIFGNPVGDILAFVIGVLTWMECCRIVNRYRAWWSLFNKGMEALRP